MPKLNSDYPASLNFRVKEKLKTDLLELDSEYAKPAREILEMFLPIKKLMANQVLVDREFKSDHYELRLTFTVDGMTIELNEPISKIMLDKEKLLHLATNILLFLNKPIINE